ncbi:MAG: AtpZ/AtpI family protein, partial [Alphaproteobacteria bacterium]|nr:AtpZ/AtpI family protein [Alphaproteobacteria bacterium]
RAGGEFMAHVIAGALMGWGLDTLFGTAPLLMVLLLLVGFATGIYRSSRVLGEK